MFIQVDEKKFINASRVDTIEIMREEGGTRLVLTSRDDKVLGTRFFKADEYKKLYEFYDRIENGNSA